MPHAVKQLGLWATTTELTGLEPLLFNKRGHHNEQPMRRSQEKPHACYNYRKPTHSKRDPTQSKVNKKNLKKKKKKNTQKSNRKYKEMQFLTD